MFQHAPDTKTLPVDPKGILRVFVSTNQVSLAVPGLEAEAGQAYIIAHQTERGACNAYVYILLMQSGTPVVYVRSAPPVPKEQMASVWAEAVSFVESMGFFLDDLNFSQLPPDKKAGLPFLKERPEEEVLEEIQAEELSPSDAFRDVKAMSDSQRKSWARFLASFCFLLIGCAAEISEKDRVDARIQFDMGVEQLTKGNFSGALQAFSQSERLDNEFADVHNALGLTNYAIGRYEESTKHYQRALAIRPTWSEAHNNYGTLLLTQSKYDEAIKHFEVALKDVLYDSPSHAEGNMGYAYFKKGDRIQAIKHIKNATLVNPKFCRGYLWLGEIYQGASELRDAERYLDRFVERCVLDPNLKSSIDSAARSEAFMRLGQVTLAAGQQGRAVAAFRQCLDAGKDTPSYDTCDRGLNDLGAR